MTTKFERFVEEYKQLCLKHKAYLSADNNYTLELYDMGFWIPNDWLDIRDKTGENETKGSYHDTP